jgi:uncharacterized protein YbjT (DUF2867 family)
VTRALVTGATGFTGSRVVPLLLDAGVEVRCFVRPTSDRRWLPARGPEIALGDLADRAALRRALEGCDALVNVASLGFGHADSVVAAAREARVARAVFVSTTAIFTTLAASSKAIRRAAEALVEGSGLRYTILRPTMIYGSSRDRNICRLVRFLRRWPVFPVTGDGHHLQQPVYVEDVAAAIGQALSSERAIDKAYNIAGAAPLTFNELVDTAAAALGRRVFKVHVPLTPFVRALALAERYTRRMPIKSEQLLRLDEDKAFSYEEAARDLGYRPRSFADGVRLEIEEMGLG